MLAQLITKEQIAEGQKLSREWIARKAKEKGRVRPARMSQAPVPTYRVEYEPSRGSWLLSGPVGAKGFLRYTSARDAAEYARWDARDRGGKIEVFDHQGRLFRSIVIEAAELADSGFVLPSV